MPRTKLERMNDIRDRLLKQGALLGTIDAFEAIVREIEDEAVAGLLRKVAQDEDFLEVNGLHADGVETIANQVENLRS